MRIGTLIDAPLLPDAVAMVRDAARDGFASAWVGETGTYWDPLTLFAACGDVGIELGTSIVVTWGRHPWTLASQALAAQAATGGRITLGIGPSHQPIVEDRYGYTWERPARHVREYLGALAPALRGEGVVAPGTTAPPVLVAAHGPVMIRLAGEQADGLITTWTGPELVESYFVPAVTEAAAGRPAPRVVASTIVSVTADPDGTRAGLGDLVAAAGNLPSYRRTLDQQGYAAAQDAVLVGDEKQVEQALRRYADAGATDLVTVVWGMPQDRFRTRAFLADLARRGTP